MSDNQKALTHTLMGEEWTTDGQLKGYLNWSVTKTKRTAQLSKGVIARVGKEYKLTENLTLDDLARIKEYYENEIKKLQVEHDNILENFVEIFNS